jgi:uncharacterized SAM-binding protein YcdF (DUF218 family)/lysophospholipase L1-like esterase
MGKRGIWNRTFWAGVVSGVALAWLARLAINESTIPDRFLAPMLLDDSSAQADAIVVLGAGVIGDCVPNLNGMRRVLLGAKLFRDGRAPLLVVTGGRGGDHHCPVAEAMAPLARDAGVPTDKILLERQSRSTHENGERTAPLLRERKVRRILLVTDRLHMRRAAGVFRHLGFEVEPSAVPIHEGHADNVSMLSAGIREAAALTYYRLRGWSRPLETTGQHSSSGARNIGTAGSVGDTVRGNLGGGVKPMPWQGTRSAEGRPVVILGASYAASWNLANLDGIPIVNAGVPGQQSFEMLARFESDVVAAHPRAVVLWGFINDIFRANDTAQSLARVCESYAEMTKHARAQGIEPIVATEVTIRPPKAFVEGVMSMVGPWFGKQSYQDRVNRHVIEGNQCLRELARREDLLVLDFQGALADTNGRRRREFATDDGSHISPQGYEALTNYARPILANRLGSSTWPGASQR